jgi:anti-sigma regulatory factor (Ser/Thr protein kinase)
MGRCVFQRTGDDQAYLRQPEDGFQGMGAFGAADALAACARAQEERSRAEKLRRDAAATRLRTQALSEQLAACLLETPERIYGDRGERFLLRLGRQPPLLGFARNDLRRWLESRELPQEIVDDVTLACSEACANALEHPSRVTRQLVEIEAHRDAAQIVLRVRDYGSWTTNGRSDLRGRGISMLGQLMDAVDIEHHPEGTEVVMRRHLATDGSRGH